MKILVICQYYHPDPSRINEVAEGLSDMGHEIIVLTGTPNYISKKTSYYKDYKLNKIYAKEKNNLKIIRVPTYNRREGKINLALSYVTYVVSATIAIILMNEKFDRVFVYQLSPVLMAIPGLLAKIKFKSPISLYCLDLWPESVVGDGITHDSLLYKIVKRISIFIYKNIDNISISSTMFENYFKDQLKINNKNYKYIPQFAEELYLKVMRTRHDGYNYIFAGNIGEEQSVKTIIYAASLLKDKNITFHIVGDGSKMHECMDISKKLKLDDKIIFYGRRPLEDMPNIYSIADAMIVTLSSNPIISYTLPGKVQSYMAAGLPLLVSANGEAQNIVKKAKCGLYCDAEDYKGFAKICLRMIESDRVNMGFNSKKYYLNNFTKESHLKSIENFIESTEHSC